MWSNGEISINILKVCFVFRNIPKLEQHYWGPLFLLEVIGSRKKFDNFEERIRLQISNYSEFCWLWKPYRFATKCLNSTHRGFEDLKIWTPIYLWTWHSRGVGWMYYSNNKGTIKNFDGRKCGHIK